MQLIKYLKDTWLLELLNMSLQISWFQPSLIKYTSPNSLFSANLPSGTGKRLEWDKHHQCVIVFQRAGQRWFRAEEADAGLLPTSFLCSFTGASFNLRIKAQICPVSTSLVPTMKAAMCCQIPDWLHELIWGHQHTLWPNPAVWFYSMRHLTQTHQ